MAKIAIPSPIGFSSSDFFAVTSQEHNESVILNDLMKKCFRILAPDQIVKVNQLVR